MDAKQLIQKAKDKAALELGWIDWACFRSDADWLDQETVIDCAMKIYAQSIAAPPKRLNTLEFTKEYFKDRSNYMFKDEKEINDFLGKWWNSQSVPPANTVTDEEIEKEIDKGLARSDYPSYEKDSGYRSGFQACVKWSRDRLSQPPKRKDEDEEKRKCIECEIEIENEIWCDMHTPLINPT